MIADSKEVKKNISQKSSIQNIKFGATLSIGEFVMPELLNRVMNTQNNINLDMLVENTESLLNKLKMVK